MQTVFTEDNSQVEWSEDYTHTQMGDITEVRTEDLPDFDLLVGGFPCQAFSIAGKRRGFLDTRGTLFFEIARILEDKRPRYLLLENVKGLLSHDKGKTVQTIFGVLTEMGYDIRYNVYNSKNHGVPQNMERIYIKGYLRERCGGEILSQTGAGRETTQQMMAYTSPTRNGKLVSVNGINGTLTSTGKDGGYSTFINELEDSPTITKDEEYLVRSTARNHQDGRIYSSKRDSSITLNCSGNNGFYIVDDKPVNDDLVEWFDDAHNFRTLKEDKAITTTTGDCFSITTRQRNMPLHKKQDNYVLEKDYEVEKVIGSTQPHAGVTDGTFTGALTTTRNNLPHLVLKDKESVCQAVLTPEREKKRQNGRRMKSDGEPMFTITATDRHGVYDGYRVRRLTPVECERLQGFPDGWTEFGADGELISNTQRYKCLGNAMTVNVVRDIFNGWDLNFN